MPARARGTSKARRDTGTVTHPVVHPRLGIVSSLARRSCYRLSDRSRSRPSPEIRIIGTRLSRKRVGLPLSSNASPLRQSNCHLNPPLLQGPFPRRRRGRLENRCSDEGRQRLECSRPIGDSRYGITGGSAQVPLPATHQGTPLISCFEKRRRTHQAQRPDLHAAAHFRSVGRPTATVPPASSKASNPQSSRPNRPELPLPLAVGYHEDRTRPRCARSPNSPVSCLEPIPPPVTPSPSTRRSCGDRRPAWWKMRI